MGDRVALMRRGVLQQVDTPMRLYNAPANLFVASFIGSPSMNLFEAELDRSNGHLVAKIGDQFLRLEPDACRARGLERYRGSTVALGIRPEHLEDAAVETGAPSERRLRATVKTVEALGAELIAHLEIAGRPVLTEEVKEVAADLDDSVMRPSSRPRRTTPSCRSSAASTSPRRARAGASIEIVVDTSQRALLRPRDRRRDRRHPVAESAWPSPPSAVRTTASPKTKRRAHRASTPKRGPRCCSCCRASSASSSSTPIPPLRGFYLSFTDFDLLQATRAAGSAWTTTRRCCRTRCSGTRSGSRSST